MSQNSEQTGSNAIYSADRTANRVNRSLFSPPAALGAGRGEAKRGRGEGPALHCGPTLRLLLAASRSAIAPRQLRHEEMLSPLRVGAPPAAHPSALPGRKPRPRLCPWTAGPRQTREGVPLGLHSQWAPAGAALEEAEDGSGLVGRSARMGRPCKAAAGGAHAVPSADGTHVTLADDVPIPRAESERIRPPNPPARHQFTPRAHLFCTSLISGSFLHRNRIRCVVVGLRPLPGTEMGATGQLLLCFCSQ